MTDPIRKTLLVPLSAADAFDLFTDRIAEWWPLESHSLSGSAEADVRVEPFEGGQVIETAPDGGTMPWARVLRWDPGARLTLAWHVGRDEADSTEVDVTFTPAGDATRVDLTHSGFDRMAEPTGMAKRYDFGWDEVLGRCYGGACARRAA